MGLSARLAALSARFDAQALQPYAPCPPAAAKAPVVDWPALRHWCLAQPARRFAVSVPSQPTHAFAHALVHTHQTVASNASARAADLALHLDGTHALLACRSARTRLALRARVKWQDWLAADENAASLPASRIWDSGRARGDAEALARFRPRRPSFIVVDSGSAAAWNSALNALQQRSGGWAYPVRLLWLLPDGAPQAADRLERDWA